MPADAADGRGRRAAARVVPRHAHISKRSGTKPQLGEAQPFVGQIEERAFGDEQRPVLAVAARFELHAFQEWRRKAIDAESIDQRRLAEIGFEAAGFSVGVSRDATGSRIAAL